MTFARPSRGLHMTLVRPSRGLHMTFLRPSRGLQMTFVRPSRGLHMTLVLVKSISGWAFMNLASISCFWLSSLVGSPMAFWRWSNCNVGVAVGGRGGQSVGGGGEVKHPHNLLALVKLQ